MSVKVLFFGQLAELTGVSSLSLSTSDIPLTTHNSAGPEPADASPTLADLQASLVQSFPALKDQHYRMTLNLEFLPESAALQAGDEVALVPPYAGG